MAAPVDRWRSGSVAVEFAMLILPLFVLMIGLVEYARLQWTRSAMQDVAIAGARCAGLAAVSCSTAGATNRVYNQTLAKSYIRTRAAGWYVALTDANVTITNNTTCDGAANLVRVQVNYTFSSPFLVPTASTQMPVSASACFPNQS